MKWWKLFARADVIYDVTNCVSLLLVGGGVWVWVGIGPALVTVGGLAIALNLLTAVRGN